jgi:hypothetical protein
MDGTNWGSLLLAVLDFCPTPRHRVSLQMLDTITMDSVFCAARCQRDLCGISVEKYSALHPLR